MKRLIKKQAKIPEGGTRAWIDLQVDKKQAVNDTYGEGDDSVCTWYQSGIIDAEFLDDAKGFNGEQHDYHVRDNGQQYFGNYPIDKWNEFLDDVQKNGFREPIEIRIHSDGEIYILEGNHRVDAAFELQRFDMPANVRYYGQSQKKYKFYQ